MHGLFCQESRPLSAAYPTSRCASQGRWQDATWPMHRWRWMSHTAYPISIYLNFAGSCYGWCFGYVARMYSTVVVCEPGLRRPSNPIKTNEAPIKTVWIDGSQCRIPTTKYVQGHPQRACPAGRSNLGIGNVTALHDNCIAFKQHLRRGAVAGARPAAVGLRTWFVFACLSHLSTA